MAASAVVLQLLIAGAAGYGAWRCVELQRPVSDPRLRALGWFFGLFAVSVLLNAAWTWQVASLAPDPGAPRTFGRPQGVEGVTVFLVGAHAFMLASLSVAVVAFGRRHPPSPAATAAGPAAALLPFALFGELVPLALALEAALTLYLAVRALLNHVERRSPGALQVAAGFALFFVGHLLFFVQHRPGQGRTSIGDVLALVGVVLLVQVLPGRRAGRRE